MEDISRVRKSLEGLTILNNSNTDIFTIGNRGDPGYILEDIRISPYES